MSTTRFAITMNTAARIVDINTDRLQRYLDDGFIVVAAGFQGTTPEGDVTTLGRGGSDTTAVALAAARPVSQSRYARRRSGR